MSEAKKAKLIVYGHPTCPSLPPVLAMLKQAQVDYEYIDIYQDYEARERVREINKGYESVPTIIFPDESSLTEPSTNALRRKLESVGYRVPLSALIVGNAWLIVIIVGVIFALLRTFNVF